jgi:hypothetical protein
VSVAIQGIAFEYNKLFVTDSLAWLAKAGCFGSISDVDLLIDHTGNSFANNDNRLDIFSGDNALVFRAYFPDKWFANDLKEQIDEVETYWAVSAGFTVKKTETIECDGVPVKVILEAKLNELSLTHNAPVIDSTYSRLVSEDKCGSLEDDYPMIMTVGRFVSLHRKAMATENDGEVKYAHSPSAYDRAADRFTWMLSRLT